jgi:hypothetical protein
MHHLKGILTIVLLVLLSGNILAQRSKKEKLEDFTFGVQFKPLIPVNYFGIEDKVLTDTIAEINVDAKFGYSLGMVMRRNFSSKFSLETGINYTRRNYNIISNEFIRDTTDKADFGFVTYEFPIEALFYIRLTDQLYMNTAAGFGINYFASDVQSVGENFLIQQITTRVRWMDFTLLANLGFEFRTEEKGNFYLGASLVNPFRDLMFTRINYYYENNKYQQYQTNLRGNYLTLDLRYFFPVIEKEVKVLK